MKKTVKNLIVVLSLAICLGACVSHKQTEQVTSQTSPPGTLETAISESAPELQRTSNQQPSSASPLVVGDRAAKQLLQRDYMRYETDEFTGLHYAEAAAGYAALKFAQIADDETLITALLQRYRNPPYTEKLLEAGHVDASVYGILPLQRYLLSGDGRALYVGLELADGQWVDTRSDGLTVQTRFWIDDIWMVNALQLQAFRATKNPVYLDRAALLTETYLRRLQQDNGLFYHGEEAHFFWGRGNGWVAAGLAELLSDLPTAHPRYEFIAARFRSMMAALLQFQAPSGLWRQLLDRPNAWEETSATAMFGYAMSVGVRRGLLVQPGYADSINRAWKGLQEHVDSLGRLGDICVGTGQSKDAQYYLQRPRVRGDLHGQAPLLWFATERLIQGQN